MGIDYTLHIIVDDNHTFLSSIDPKIKIALEEADEIRRRAWGEAIKNGTAPKAI